VAVAISETYLSTAPGSWNIAPGSAKRHASSFPELAANDSDAPSLSHEGLMILARSEKNPNIKFKILFRSFL